MRCLSHNFFAQEEVAKVFSLGFLLGITLEQRREDLYNLLLVNRFSVELPEPLTMESAPKVQVVEPGSSAYQSNLGHVWSRAAVRATGHSDGDRILVQSGCIKRTIEP